VIRNAELIALAALVLGFTAWSWHQPADRLTWWLEALPVLIALPLLAATRVRFPLTRLAYWLIAVHSLVLLVGAHYTYARVPLGFWMEEAFGFARNHYDRIGHLTQGFIPAILAREILLRHRVLTPGGWLFFLVCCFVLALAASYELIEWWTAVIAEQGAIAFLGTQGDPWDTQWDMLFALLGGVAAQLLLARVHDRQLAHLPAPGGAR
jgi:putative membrane protein